MRILRKKESQYNVNRRVNGNKAANFTISAAPLMTLNHAKSILRNKMI